MNRARSSLNPAVARELAELQDEMSRCRRCIEAGFAVCGPPVFAGDASAPIMVIGQAPARADLQAEGRPWSGAGGKRLFAWISDAGFDPMTFRQSVYFSALTRCYPGKNLTGRGDRAPTAAEMQLCIPFLRRELDLLRPALVITVGRMAAEHFLGPAPLRGLVGQSFLVDPAMFTVPQGVRPAETWLVPLPHPSGANIWLNRPENKELVTLAIRQLEMGRRRLEKRSKCS